MFTLEEAMDAMARLKSAGHAADLEFYNAVRTAALNDLRIARKAKASQVGYSRVLARAIEADQEFRIQAERILELDNDDWLTNIELEEMMEDLP